MGNRNALPAILAILAILIIVAVAAGRRWREAPMRGRAARRGKAGFRPIPVSTCGQPYDSHYAVDMTARNAAGTVVWDPFSTQSRVSLERGAESPEVAEELNPVSGLGKTSSLRAMTDRYRRGEALRRLSVYELRPGEPGSLEPAEDGAMSLLAKVAKRAPLGAKGGPSPCSLAYLDAGADYYTDGLFGDAVLQD